MYLGLYSSETEACIHKLYMMCTAALLIITQNWKQPRCPLNDEYVNKLLHQYNRNSLSSELKEIGKYGLKGRLREVFMVMEMFSVVLE